MVFYNIHNLVGVFVEDGISSLIINTVNSQIGYFRQDHITDTLYQIVVRPYIKLIDTEYLSQEFLLHKEEKKYLILNSMKLGIEKVETGYNVYAENPNIPLIHLIHYLLLKCDCTIIHGGGATSIDGKGILIPGVAGVGKTSLLIHLIRNYKYRLVGDDYVIISKNGMLSSFPKRSVTIKPHLAIEQPDLFKSIEPTLYRKLISKTKKFIAQNAPFRGIAEKLLYKEGTSGNIVRSFSVRSDHQVPLNEVYGENKLVDSGKLNKIIFLQKHIGNLSLNPITEKSMCQRIIASTHNEWVDSIRVIFSLSTVETNDVLDYFDDVKTIIRSGIKGKGCWLLMIPDRASIEDIYEKIKEIL